LLNVDTEGAIRSLLCGALLAPWATIAGAAEFLGPLVGLLDGDIIEVLHNNHPEHIRLNGIDCPEKVQAYSKHAQEGRP
jgi:endonuclease YncB( thermonuclease family)